MANATKEEKKKMMTQFISVPEKRLKPDTSDAPAEIPVAQEQTAAPEVKTEPTHPAVPPYSAPAKAPVAVAGEKSKGPKPQYSFYIEDDLNMIFLDEINRRKKAHLPNDSKTGVIADALTSYLTGKTFVCSTCGETFFVEPEGIEKTQFCHCCGSKAIM